MLIDFHLAQPRNVDYSKLLTGDEAPAVQNDDLHERMISENELIGLHNRSVFV